MYSTWLFFIIGLIAWPASATEFCDWQTDGFSIPRPLCGLSGDAGRGRELVALTDAGNCMACHVFPIPEEPFQGTVGPALTGVGNRLTAAEIRLRVVDEQQLNPSTIMPPFYRDPKTLNQVAFEWYDKTMLTAQQVEDIIAYLVTLQGTPP